MVYTASTVAYNIDLSYNKSPGLKGIFMEFSLRNKLLFFFGVLVILPIVVGNFILLDASTQAAQEHMRRLNQNNARLAGMKVNEVMDAVFHLSIYIGMENSIVEYLNASQDDPMHTTLEARAQSTLTSLMTSSNYLNAISIVSMDGRNISRGGLRAVTISEEDMIRADALAGFFFWDIVHTDQGPAIYLCRLMRYVNDLSHHLGYVKMIVSLQGISDLLTPPANYPRIHYLILDGDGEVVLSSGDQNLLNGDFYASSHMLSNGWQLFSIISDSNLLLPGFAQTTAVTMALVFLICMLLASLFSKRIVKYAYQLRSYKAQLMEMESKINPHFLYNALDSIYWMAKLKRHEEVSGMSNALSKLFRLALSADSSGFVKLSKELEYLSCYQQIQHYRYGDDIVFTISVDESLNDQTVCRFVLQPIVENAVIHGLANQKRGTIDVRVFREEKVIVYRVSDSGGCVNPEAVYQLLQINDDEVEGTKGLALRNIQNRIHLCYGKSYGLDCFIRDGTTIFEVRQPYQ